MNKTNLFSTIFVKRFAELKVFFLIIFQQLNTDFFKLEFLIFFFYCTECSLLHTLFSSFGKQELFFDLGFSLQWTLMLLELRL